MRLTPLKHLFPDVSESGDRLIYFVKSRSGDGEWRVDKERRHGMGECECPASQKGGNHECFHIKRVNAFMACQRAQQIMLATLKNS